MNSNIISDNSKSKNTVQKQSVDYEKALNTYYKMKHNYEKEIKDKVENIRQSLSLDEGIVFRKINLKKAKKEMQDFKAKCQNCKRNVGMIFTTTFNKENLTPVIKCVCGDTTSPCNLNIALETGTIQPLQDIIHDETKDIDGYKEKIIIDKNKLLFGFLTADKVLDNYEKYKEELNMSFERFDFYFQEYNGIVNDTKKEQQIKTLQVEFNNYVQELRENMKKFEISREKQYLDSAVEIHNNISNKAKELEELKYNDMRIEKDEVKGTFHLIQCKVTIPELETVLSNPSVISFVTNATEFITNTNKPTSQSSSPKSQSSLFSILPFVGETQKQNVEVQQTQETEQTKESGETTKTNENRTEDKSSSDSVKSGFELIEDNIMSLFNNE
jgi:hypothetical protein